MSPIGAEFSRDGDSGGTIVEDWDALAPAVGPVVTFYVTGDASCFPKPRLHIPELATLADLLLELRWTRTVTIEGSEQEVNEIFGQFWRAALDRSLSTTSQAARLWLHVKRVPWLASGVARWMARSGSDIVRRVRV